MTIVKFGTDGIRGKANEGYLTPDVLTKIGMACGSYFYKPKKSRQLVVIGKDTRLSGYLIEPALTSGLISTGLDVLLVGPMPTPAISMLIKSLRADFGIMISASHNQFADNGIKIFDSEGYKLTKDDEKAIEHLINNFPKGNNSPIDQRIGRAKRLDDAPGRYIEYVKNTFPKNLRLFGKKIVVDTANGAAYHLAHKIFWELGAEVVAIGDQPDGLNINFNCGSTHPKRAINAVIKHQADLGIVLDGDADRLLMIDEKGEVVNGDKILACIASGLKKENKLHKDTVVCTAMSNTSFINYCHERNIKTIVTDVGDKFVSYALRDGNYSLGGEQSGHIIASENSTTGDGIIAALSMLYYFINSNKSKFSDFSHPFELTPQNIHNIEVKPLHKAVASSPELQAFVIEKNNSLHPNGRLNVRASGTEPLIRVMVESKDSNIIDKITTETEQLIENLIQNF